MAEITAIELAATGIVVVDLEASLAFYTDVFGLRETSRFRADVLSLDEVILSAPGGGSSVILMHYDDSRPPKHVGQKLVFYVPDPRAVAERVRSRGGTVLWGPEEIPHLGATVTFVQDPDGHWIEALDARVQEHAST